MPWLYQIKSILTNCGNFNIWQSHNIINRQWLKLTVRQKLKDLFINNWYSSVENSSNGTFYRLIKKSFGYEQYLSNTQNNLLRYIIQFRTRNHRLPVETGNWNEIALNERYCNNCREKLGDEFH